MSLEKRKQLIENIRQWGADKGLDKVGHLPQAKYTLKETAELLDAYARGDIAEINDAIGDIAVTLIVGASNDKDIYNELVEEILDELYSATVISEPTLVRNSIPDLVSDVFSLIQRKNKPSHYDYIDCFRSLNKVKTRINDEFDFVCSTFYCVELAYNEIKNRTGKTVNGEFVKD